MTGYGIILSERQQLRAVSFGAIRTSGSFPERLRVIFETLSEVIGEHGPDEVAVETVFVRKNVDSALKLGQARGAAICAAVSASLEVREYAPRAIKLAVVGNGGAEKPQIEHMVRRILSIRDPIQADAADALATAICHAHHRSSRIPAA